MSCGINDVISRLNGVKETAGGFVALCPAHEDNHASLSVSEGDDGRILLYCHAGCSADAVAGALGFSLSDLMGADKRQPKRKKRVVAEYDYRDANGVLLFQKVRYEPKSFAIRRKNERGEWEYNRKGITLVPYNLQGFINHDEVFLVEGEKDVETLGSMKIAATCSPDGAGNGKFKKDIAKWFATKCIYILTDNDPVGKSFSHEEAKKLLKIAKAVKLLDLLAICPDLPEHGDITDVVERLGAEKTKAALLSLCQKAEEYQAQPEEDGVAFGDNDLALNEYYRHSGYYKVYDERLVRMKNESDPFIICSGVPIPIKEVKRDDGVSAPTLSFVLKGWVKGTGFLPEVTIPASKLTGMAWLKEHWGFAMRVSPSQTAKIYVEDAVMEAGNVYAVRETIYMHSGWRKINGKWVFLYNGGAIGGDAVKVELTGRLARYGFTPTAGVNENHGQAVNAVMELFEVAPKRVIFPLLAIAFLSPLNEFFRPAGIEPDYIVMLLGRTGSYKSELASLFLSFFGRFTGKTLPMSFKDTITDIEKKSSALKDVLVVLDDYLPNTNRVENAKMAATAQQIARSYGDRTGRGRSNADLTSKEVYIPRGNLIITGEDAPAVGESGLARFLFLSLEKGDIDQKNLTDVSASRDCLSSLMRGYIEWLLPMADSLPKSLTATFINYRQAAQDNTRHARMASVIAFQKIAMDFFFDYMVHINALPKAGADEMKAEAEEQFWANAQTQTEAINEEKPAEMFLSALRELLATGQCVVTKLDRSLPWRMSDDELNDRPKGWIGYLDGEYYMLHVSVAYKEVFDFLGKQGVSFPVGKNTLLKHLALTNAIACQKPGAYTNVMWINNKAERLTLFFKHKIDVKIDESRKA